MYMWRILPNASALRHRRFTSTIRTSRRFLEEAGALKINGADAAKDAEIYKHITEEQLITLGNNLFLYFLHDDYTRRFRKMLTIEQFHDKKLAAAYMKQYVDDPLSYQGMLFGLMVSSGVLQTENVEIMTLHFYAPIYMLLTICDRNPEREKEALKTMEAHVRQFNKLYARDEKNMQNNKRRSQRRNIK